MNILYTYIKKSGLPRQLEFFLLLHCHFNRFQIEMINCKLRRLETFNLKYFKYRYHYCNFLHFFCFQKPSIILECSCIEEEVLKVILIGNGIFSKKLFRDGHFHQVLPKTSKVIGILKNVTPIKKQIALICLK